MAISFLGESTVEFFIENSFSDTYSYFQILSVDITREAAAPGPPYEGT